MVWRYLYIFFNLHGKSYSTGEPLILPTATMFSSATPEIALLLVTKLVKAEHCFGLRNLLKS
jgi:hypothetical protein